jgi:hypothetical protein
MKRLTCEPLPAPVLSSRRGLLRGVAPRMASSAMWGTAMVSVYEFLKRLCALPPQ